MAAEAPGLGREAARWLGGFAVAVALHGGLAALLLAHADDAGPSPSPAIMLDLALLPTAPAVEPVETPPGPEQVESIEPEPPEPEPELPLDIELPDQPVLASDFTLPLRVEPPPKPPEPPKPVERRKPEPRPVREKPPSPETTAPQSAPATPAPVAAAPPVAAPARTVSATPSWQSLVLAHLERHKRYPAMAQSRRQQGVVHLRFTVARDGQVRAAAIARGSGYAALDEAVMDMVQRANPLPAFPADMAGDSIELIVPVRFFLR